jgi:hypothetical protein
MIRWCSLSSTLLFLNSGLNGAFISPVRSWSERNYHQLRCRSISWLSQTLIEFGNQSRRHIGIVREHGSEWISLRRSGDGLGMVGNMMMTEIVFDLKCVDAVGEGGDGSGVGGGLWLLVIVVGIAIVEGRDGC